MSFLKKIKTLVKSNFPLLTNFLIRIRDNSKFIRILKRPFFISLTKNIHGKKIIKKERGLLFDFSIDNFVSYVFRPKNSSDINSNIEYYDNDSTAIIIQGSIKGLEKFVEETLLIYKKLFKDNIIILSTWENDINNHFLEKFNNDKNIKIILNSKPITDFNVDLQTYSTNSALLYADEKKIKYCVKTRTDCRIYKKNSIFFLKNLLKNYPISKNYQFLRNRIISCSTDTRKYRVYGLSDIFLFGATDNLKSYFSKNSFKNSLAEMNLGNYPCIKNDTAIINEIFLCARYMQKNNIEMQWTLKDWWNKCREIFLIVDSNSLDFFWYKYEWRFEQSFDTNYTTNFDQSIQHSDWLNLYTDNKFFFNENLKEKWKIQDGVFVQ